MFVSSGNLSYGLLMPYADGIPAWLIPFWGTLIWLVGQIWYILKMKEKPGV
ncbi:MAG: hypothetical protein H5T63_00435 [Chloroflexi bacterium]|nr:hypothetical protein [Chloroflexota bacterium]